MTENLLVPIGALGFDYDRTAIGREGDGGETYCVEEFVES